MISKDCPIFGTCRPGGDRKREYYFLEGMTFPAETVIVLQTKIVTPSEPIFQGFRKSKGRGNVWTFCIDCDTGEYSASIASTGCTSCEAGKFSGATAASTCADCGAGKYANWRASTCRKCEEGKYSASIASTGCTSCEAGKFSAAVGATAASTCASCGAGKYSKVIIKDQEVIKDTSVCIDCLAFFYDDCEASAAGVCICACMRACMCACACVCVCVCTCVHVHAVQNWRVKQISKKITKKWCAERCDKEKGLCTGDRVFTDCRKWCTNWRCSKVEQEEEQTEEEIRKIPPFTVACVVVSILSELFTLWILNAWVKNNSHRFSEGGQYDGILARLFQDPQCLFFYLMIAKIGFSVGKLYPGRVAYGCYSWSCVKVIHSCTMTLCAFAFDLCEFWYSSKMVKDRGPRKTPFPIENGSFLSRFCTCAI